MASSQKRPIFESEHAKAGGDRCAKAAKLRAPEDFTPCCPVHGLIRLPWIAKAIVDTEAFQRMRHIKQLGLSSYVYPGAKHDRFFHSIGTAFLAKQFVDSLRQRQPELDITERDILCVMLAGLCHDLGHPCFSHMFERFVHRQGCERRQKLLAAARTEGRQELSTSEEAEVRLYKDWSHELASIRIVDALFEQLHGQLAEAGLRADGDGNDFACIRELIDPPKEALEKLQEAGMLRKDWSTVIRGRPVEKAWLYEVVSNWRSGVDVDKFDYFRRDAQCLGIQRQFDHDRYITGVRVELDSQEMPTISPPEKDADLMRDMFELRKMLHRAAYQHKTVKKLEMHVTDILLSMDETVRIRGSGGKLVSMSEAAVSTDIGAYLKLTDTFVEAKLLDDYDDAQTDGLTLAAMEYKLRICKRKLMKTVGVFNLAAETAPNVEHVKETILRLYSSPSGASFLERPMVKPEELRCEVGTFHYGMKHRDPISRIVWHNPKEGTIRSLPDGFDAESRPQRHKLFVFWNPPAALTDKGHLPSLALEGLKAACQTWQQQNSSSAGRVIAGASAAPGSPVPQSRRACLAETPEKVRLLSSKPGAASFASASQSKLASDVEESLPSSQ